MVDLELAQARGNYENDSKNYYGWYEWGDEEGEIIIRAVVKNEWIAAWEQSKKSWELNGDGM